MNKASPPKLPLRFFRWYCHPDYQEDIEGDLRERFERRLEMKGIRAAKWGLFMDVIRLFRPGIIRSLEGSYQVNQYGMFKIYFKIALRNLKKNVLFSSINIAGLAISMSVGILMIILFSELYSFDDFHEQKENIYRVTSKRTMLGQKQNLATASIYIGNEIKRQVPGVEKLLIMRQGMSADLRTERGPISITGFYASVSFFDIFSFELNKGNPETALLDPNSIVLTESTSKKIFGSEDPIGKSLNIESYTGYQNRAIEGIITGVLEDPPINSHLQFEVLVSLKTLDNHPVGSNWNNDFKTNPKDVSSSYVYLVLNEHSRKEEVENAIAKIMADHNSKAEAPITHLLQPMEAFVTSTGSLLENLPGPSIEKQKIYVMIGLTLVVLLSACFNYTNLSLARALRRSKEIGIRKVVGATRFQVFAQFVVEAVILALIAVIIGLGIFFLIKPEFLKLPNPTFRGYQMFLLDVSYLQLLYLVVLGIGVGCLAGFLPAMFLSKLRARIIYTDASKEKIFSGISLRRALIVFQFTLSICLIMSAVLIYNQYKFALDYDLGYTTENIVNINVKGDYASLLENKFATIPEVMETSKSSMVLGIGGATMGLVESEDRSNSMRVLVNDIDEKYLDMHAFEILAGSGFQTPLTEGENQKYIVVNEEFLKELNLGSPKEAIGKIVRHNDNKLMIRGVVRDFINMSLTMELERSFAFIQTSRTDRYQTLGVKLRSNDLKSTLLKLEESYKELDPVHPFEASFYDDKIAETYQQHKANYTIISFLAFLAISISTFGLLGMAVFTTESRMKEISIRRVLGADIRNLTLLLSKGFLAMIVVAGLIAMPITLYFIDDLVLNEFMYRAEMGLLEISSGFIVVLLIGALTITWQIREAIIQNPAELLQDE